MLAQAGVDGRLATRADASRHQGDFRTNVEGVNETLDAVVGPLGTAAVLERLARRDLTARATGSFQGDHARIQQAINATAGLARSARAAAGEMDKVIQQNAASAEQSSAAAAELSGQSEELDAMVATFRLERA
jgi:methyl-accepting chemotaxis protein